MKVKWLVILFMLLVLVMFIGLLPTHQSTKNISLSQKGILTTTKQQGNQTQPIYQAQIPVPRPLITGGITIIKTPPAELKNKPPKVVERKMGSVINGSLANNPSVTQTQQANPAESVKVVKQPTPKESEEMNAKGIVIY